MPDETEILPEDQGPIAAREQSAPEPQEPAPRGNLYSEPDEMPDQDMPPPHPS